MVPKNRTKTKKHLGWRVLWRCLLEPRMWTSFFLRCKKIPICWFFVKFFPIFVIKTMFYGLDLDPDLLWSKKRSDPYGIWIQQNALIRIETQWIYTEITNNEKLLRWNFDIRNFVPVLGKNFGKGIFSWKYQPWLLGIGKFKYTNVNFVIVLQFWSSNVENPIW